MMNKTVWNKVAIGVTTLGCLAVIIAGFWAIWVDNSISPQGAIALTGFGLAFVGGILGVIVSEL